MTDFSFYVRLARLYRVPLTMLVPGASRARLRRMHTAYHRRRR